MWPNVINKGALCANSMDASYVTQASHMIMITHQCIDYMMHVLEG